MVLLHLAAAAAPPSSGIPASDYLIIGCITALAMAIPGILAWHSAAKGRKESSADVALQNLSLANKFEEVGLNFQRMDLRFDKMEGTLDTHLDWHRVEAEHHLPEMIKETANVHHTSHPGS